MSKSENMAYNFCVSVTMMVIMAAIYCLWAFPLMWAWNFVIPEMFGLPELTWGKAWCLWFVCCSLIKGYQYSRDVVDQ